MTNLRDAVLLGTGHAAALHEKLQVRQRVTTEHTAVDVFDAIERLGLLLLFRPLTGLLGACIQSTGGRTGVLVTTRRDLHMQRFTAAHELGHVVLGHEGRLDREICLPGSRSSRDLNEIAADAFAAEFLMPRWLYISLATRHGWVSAALRDPHCAYQLSLRMGVSYDAACLGLLTHKILDTDTVAALRRTVPKSVKQALLGRVSLGDPWADVWSLGERDEGQTLEAGPNDLFIADLEERGDAGYLWSDADLTADGAEIVEDQSDTLRDYFVGGTYRRRLLLRMPGRGRYQLRFVERRPWLPNSAPLRAYTIVVNAFGAEGGGLHRRSSWLAQRSSAA